MSRDIGDEMDDDAVTAFLQQEGIGILGLANDGQAYTIPIAFAFDPEEERCILRLVNAETSRKAEYVGETELASLTVHDWKDSDDWRSVVLEGTLQPIPDDDIAHAAALFSDVGAQAALDVFNRPLSAYETLWYELDVQEVSGRTAVGPE